MARESPGLVRMLLDTESAGPKLAARPLPHAFVASPDEPIADPLVGLHVNHRFRLVSLIARGGMGRVYRAEQAPVGRICAVKLLDCSRAGEAGHGLAKRFWLEAAVTSRLSHPNIVTVFDCGRTGGGDIPYIAMEYLLGCTLSRAIRAAGYFSEERTVHVARQICSALREAHGAGVVHRDLKPTNVFLVDNCDVPDFVKVLDFGLVTSVVADRGEDLTEANLVLGSPRYMAPEQIRGEKVDARADIYSLGIVMYEMLTGSVPFGGPSHARILTAHLNETAPPMARMGRAAEPSPEMDQIVRRCIEKDRERRFRSMGEVLSALDRVTEPLPAYTAALCDAAPYPPDCGEDGTSPNLGARAHEREGLVRPGIVGGLTVAAIAALVASTAKRPLAAPEPVAAVSDPAPNAAPSPVSADQVTETAASPQDVTIEVISEPAASRVTEDDVELCRTTPCAILYEAPSNDREAAHVLTIARSGFRSETRRVTAADSPVTVRLAPIPAVAPAAPPRPGLDKSGLLLSGYRLDVPY